MKQSSKRATRLVIAAALVAGLAACGSSKTITTAEGSTSPTTGGSASPTTAAGGSVDKGAPITLAVNPWTGSAVNANVAKVVLESKLGTTVTLTDIDENATWVGMDKGDIDAVLEQWPSGHGPDMKTYIDEKKTVVNLGVLGPQAKIGWYVNSAALAADPKVASWEGFKDAATAGKFATAETGDQGRFLMGDPSYVSFDEQIIANLKLPLKYTVAGTEAALITAIKQAETDKKPILLQFWQPHWLQSKVKLTEVKLPAVTPECLASADAKDGKYACDYAPDPIFKAASVKLENKNAKAFAFLKKITLTTDQQNEIAAMIDGDGMKADAAAKKWVDANAKVVDAWLAK
jgi:glycine betaine/proline transport system substrate-binding protein